jgi:hypothetical protein
MSYSSAAYRAVSHPIHLPVKPYWVYGADALTQKLVRLVARLRPGADCLGVIGPDQELPAPQGAGFVLITDADWEERARRLSGAGWSAEQVMVLPLAVDCPSSGFSRFLNEMSDLVDVSDGPDRVHLPQDMATTILMREGIAKLEGGRIGISSTLYRLYTSPIVSNRAPATSAGSTMRSPTTGAGAPICPFCGIRHTRGSMPSSAPCCEGSSISSMSGSRRATRC